MLGLQCIIAGITPKVLTGLLLKWGLIWEPIRKKPKWPQILFASGAQGLFISFHLLSSSFLSQIPKRVVRARGITSPAQKKEGEAEYLRIVKAWNEHLAQGIGVLLNPSKLTLVLHLPHDLGNRFMFGDRPCAADTVIMGGLLAHFWKDPVPKRHLQP